MSTREIALMKFNMLGEDDLNDFIVWYDNRRTEKNVSYKSEMSIDEESRQLLSVISGMGEDMFPEGRRTQFQPERDIL